MELKDNEIALRWWERRTESEKKQILKKQGINIKFLNSINENSIISIWINQDHNK